MDLSIPGAWLGRGVPKLKDIERALSGVPSDPGSVCLGSDPLELWVGCHSYTCLIQCARADLAYLATGCLLLLDQDFRIRWLVPF